MSYIESIRSVQKSYLYILSVRSVQKFYIGSVRSVQKFYRESVRSVQKSYIGSVRSVQSCSVYKLYMQNKTYCLAVLVKFALTHLNNFLVGLICVRQKIMCYKEVGSVIFEPCL